MNKLYPKDLENTYSVVGQADATVAVITAWDSGQAPAINTYHVSDLKRLKDFCESHDIYFVSSPSPEMGEFDDVARTTTSRRAACTTPRCVCAR